MSPVDTLLALHGTMLPGEMVELRAVHHATGEMYRTWYPSYRAVVQEALQLSPDGWNTWYGINPRRGKTAGDANCTRATSLPADVDAKLWDGEMASTLAAIESCTLRPSALICSGGGYQPRWLLDVPLDLQEPGEAQRYRRATTRLGRAVCGADRRADTISNPERILRIPDSLNWKYSPPRPVTVAYCEPSIRYSIRAVEDWLDSYAPWTALPTPVERPPQPQQIQGDGVIGDFNARYDAVALLLAHGASVCSVHGSVTHLTRPGKQRDTSATWGYYPNTLIVFTEAWPPLESWAVPGQRRRGYDAFELFSLLEHGGNRGRAYQAACDAGYGRRVIHGMDTYTKHAAGTLRALCGAHP